MRLTCRRSPESAVWANASTGAPIARANARAALRTGVVIGALDEKQWPWVVCRSPLVTGPERLAPAIVPPPPARSSQNHPVDAAAHQPPPDRGSAQVQPRRP